MSSSLSNISSGSSSSKSPANLPTEIWSKVISYSDRSSPLAMARLELVSKAFHQVLQGEKEFYYAESNNHPMIRFICEHSTFLQDLPYKQKIPVLDQYLKYASGINNIIRTIDNLAFLVPTFDADVHTIRERVRTGIAVEPFQTNTWKDPLRTLAKHVKTISYDDLFLSSILKGDIGFFPHFTVELIDQKYIDYAAYFLLLNQRIEEFRSLLGYTSVFEEDNVNPDVLKTFLIVTLEINRMDLFQELIHLKRPFFPSQVLVAAAEFNRGNAIRLLLRERLPFYEEFVPDNARDSDAWHTDGLHTALMVAANKNNLDAMHAILEGRPGKSIDIRILQDIKELFENHESQQMLQYYENTDWLERDLHPNRNGIIQIFNKEIADRFPDQGEEKVLENKSPI